MTVCVVDFIPTFIVYKCRLNSFARLKFDAGFAIVFSVFIIIVDNKESPSAERINLCLNMGPVIKPSLLYACFYYILVWEKWHL